MPGLPPERDPTSGQHLLALGTLGGDTVLETGHAVNIFVIRDDERLCPHLEKANDNLYFVNIVQCTLVVQTLQWKQVSCHCLPLYSIFFVPARKVWPETRIGLQ